MLRTIIIAALAACGVSSIPATAEPPDEYEPTEPDVKPLDQHFCCQSLDPKSPSGNDCVPVDESHLAACNKVLYCEGSYTNDDGKVTCY